MFQTPDFLCIGFFCHDVHEDGYILGGTASYASLMASKLGKKTAVLTSVGEDFLFLDTFKQAGITTLNKVAPKTTVFENKYQHSIRTQYIYDRALTLEFSDVLHHWRKTPIVKLCSIANEIDASLFSAFPDALVGATIQGLLRQWDKNGKITPKAMDWNLLSSVNVVLLSDADIEGYEDKLATIIDLVEVVVLTKGKDGASVFYQNQVYNFPAFPVTEVDPTGAGDVFAASFLVQYAKKKDIALATAFAHAAASFVVEGIGVQLPTAAAIHQRWVAYQNRFPSFFK